jgi:2-methylcitrate dehydratase PrpD
VTIESLTDERVLTEDVQELMKKIEIRVDSSLPKDPDLRHHPVAIRLRDGKEVAGAQLLAAWTLEISIGTRGLVGASFAITLQGF